MWMIKRALGWIAILALCVVGLNFWRTYIFVKVENNDSGMPGVIKEQKSYFIEVDQDLDQMRQDGEVIQFLIPGQVDANRSQPIPYFGRIIARPGDRVEITNGIIRVNGIDVQRLGHVLGYKDMSDPKYDQPTIYDFDPILVGRELNYVAVDNWKVSSGSFSLHQWDSRKIGLIPDSHIIGKKSELDLKSFGIQLGFVVLLGFGYLFVDRFVK